MNMGGLLRPCIFLGLLVLILSYQNCSEKQLSRGEDGGFVLGSFADLVGTPCERFAAGLEEVATDTYLIDLDQGGPLNATRVHCLDHTGGETIELTFVENAYNVDLALMLKNPTVKIDIVANIPSGIKIGSKTVFLPAFKTGILHSDSRVTINNEGHIQGAGGKGGHAGACGAPSLPGEKGGAGIEVFVPTVINTLGGKIDGGGGGGGGGGDACQIVSGQIACAGGGGGGGGAGSDFGQGGTFTSPEGSCNKFSGNFPGANGSSESGGSSFGSHGGQGGGPGQPGTQGQSHSGLSTSFGQSGGDAGEAIIKNNHSVMINGLSNIRGPIEEGVAPTRNPISL